MNKLRKYYTDGFWNLFVPESQSISIRNKAEFFLCLNLSGEAIFIEQKGISFEIFESNPSKNNI